MFQRDAESPRLPRRELLAMAGLGFLAVPLNQGLFLAGLARTTPGHAALLYALTPVFVFLLARVRRLIQYRQMATAAVLNEQLAA